MSTTTQATAADYIADACAALMLKPADLFGKASRCYKGRQRERRRVYRTAVKFAAEDFRTFSVVQWCEATGMSESMIRNYAAEPQRVRARVGDMDQVIAESLKVCGVKLESMRSVTRHPAVVECRMLIIRAARTVTDLSYPEIARAMGRPNHSTVITADQRLGRLLDTPEGGQLAGRLELILEACVPTPTEMVL